MGEFSQFDAEAPAALGAVVEAVTRLSTLSEAKILELVSAGKVADLFALKPAGDRADPVRYRGGRRACGGVRITLKSERARRANPSSFHDLAKNRPRRNARFRVGGWFRFVAPATLGLLVRASPRLAH